MSKPTLSTNHKILFWGVGRVDNCTCADLNELRNQYHLPSCKSYTNMTFHFRLTWWERIKSYFVPLEKLSIKDLRNKL